MVLIKPGRVVASNQIFRGPDGEKIIDLPEGQINDPLSEKLFSVVLSNSLVSVSDP